MKSIIKTTPLPPHTKHLISTVLRPTKDLYIVVQSSSLRPDQPPHHPHPQHPSFSGFQSAMPATPLSAALGSAVQATMPLHLDPAASGYGPGSYSAGHSAASSRTGTGLSSLYTPSLGGVSRSGSITGSRNGGFGGSGVEGGELRSRLKGVQAGMGADDIRF